MKGHKTVSMKCENLLGAHSCTKDAQSYNPSWSVKASPSTWNYWALSLLIPIWTFPRLVSPISPIPKQCISTWMFCGGHRWLSLINIHFPSSEKSSLIFIWHQGWDHDVRHSVGRGLPGATTQRVPVWAQSPPQGKQSWQGEGEQVSPEDTV